MTIPLWQLPKAERNAAQNRMRQLAARIQTGENEIANLAQQMQHAIHNLNEKRKELKDLLDKHGE